MNKLINIFIISIAVFFLTGCVARDSEASKFSKHVYKQNGKYYRILNTNKNYKENGLASWYGKKFNKHRTSSGERYNMYKMTAAHKTLPLSSYVEVTNLKNGKQVIVRVNDRGPFIRNRLIDLSYAAAKKLGMIHQGTVPVSVKVINA